MPPRSSVVGVVALCAWLLSSCSDGDPYTDPQPTRGPIPPETTTNYALSFDGVDDYVTSATSGFPFSEVSQTLAAWIKLDDSEGQHAILTMRRFEESGTMFGVEAGRLVAYNIYGMRLFAEDDATLGTGEWHHVAYSQEAIDPPDPENYVQRLYVDGELVATGELAPQNRTPIAGFIGAFSSQRSLFSGEIDELRLWARKLDDDEIAALAQGTSASSAELVGYWSFNETPGEHVAYDRSAFENHATLGDGAPEYMPRRVVSDR